MQQCVTFLCHSYVFSLKTIYIILFGRFCFKTRWFCSAYRYIFFFKVSFLDIYKLLFSRIYKSILIYTQTHTHNTITFFFLWYTHNYFMCIWIDYFNYMNMLLLQYYSMYYFNCLSNVDDNHFGGVRLNLGAMWCEIILLFKCFIFFNDLFKFTYKLYVVIKKTLHFPSLI